MRRSSSERPALLQLRHDLVDGLDHAREVVRGGHHVLETMLQRLTQGRPGLRVVDLHDLAVHQRFARLPLARRAHRDGCPALVALDVEHRVDDVLDRELLRVQVLTDRVHDERALGDVRPHHRDRRVPPLDRDVGVLHLHVDAIGARPLQEAESAERKVREGVRAALVQELGGGLREEDLRELDHQLGLGGVHLALELAADGVHRGRVPAKTSYGGFGGIAHKRGKISNPRAR